MHRRTPEPSRLPLRGTIAFAGTIGALALLFSFRGGPLAPSEAAQAFADTASATEELVAGPSAVGAAEGVGASSSGSAAGLPVASAVPAGASPAPLTATPTTIEGEAYSFRWGTVQLAVTVEAGDIVDVQALQLPDGDRHSAYISEVVEPILREEAISSDSADVSVISGATYTSRGYAASLQSALDQLETTAPAGGEAPLTATAAETAAPEAASTPVETAPAVASATTVSGDPQSFRWGTVQVAVTAVGSDIVDVQALRLPDGDRRSMEISQYVEPILREEAISSDSADVSVISGATYTSRGYAASLQSALDQLGV